MEATAAPVAWSEGDVRTLLETMKNSIASREKSKVWSAGLKSVDWATVAFRGFTAEECRAKWDEIMKKLRKIKTLTELIVDAQKAVEGSNFVAKLKQPKLPKRAINFYYMENFEKLKRKKPSLSSQQLLTYANKKYKKLPPEKKEKYLQLAKEANKQYQTTMDELRKTHQLKRKRKKTCKKEKKSVKPVEIKVIREQVSNKTPLRLKNGYQLFCQEQTPHMVGTPKNRRTAIWSERWRNLSEEERAEYVRRCREMRSKDQMFPDEPKMPSSSICGLHFKKKFAEMKGDVKSQKEQRELFAKFSQEAKYLSQKEKEEYQKEIDHNFCIYKTQLRNWFKTLKPKMQVKYCELKPSKLKYLHRKMESTQHRTSDSEDEEFTDSSDEDDLTVIEIDREIKEDEEEYQEIFNLF